MRTVLNKILVVQFYRFNAGFFFVVLMLMFGIMNGRDALMLHFAIMQNISSSLPLMFIAAGIFALYWLKCTAFYMKELSWPEHSMLYELQAIPGGQLFSLFAANFGAAFAPCLVYGGITVAIGFMHGHILVPALLGLSIMGLFLGGVAMCYNKITTPWKLPLLSIPQFRLSKRRSLAFILLHFSFEERKRTFFSVKVVSLALLHIMVITGREHFSREAVSFLMLFGISAHALFPHYYTRFMEREFSIFRNLPVTAGYRFGIYALTYSLVFLPELVFLFVNEPQVLPLSYKLSIYLLAVSQSLFFTSALYIKAVNVDRYTGLVGGVFVASIFLLTTFAPWVLALVYLFAALILFLVVYWRYEPLYL